MQPETHQAGGGGGWLSIFWGVLGDHGAVVRVVCSAFHPGHGQFAHAMHTVVNSTSMHETVTCQPPRVHLAVFS